MAREAVDALQEDGGAPKGPAGSWGTVGMPFALHILAVVDGERGALELYKKRAWLCLLMGEQR